MSLTPREARTIARVVKVNHAGEFGAIRIYTAQIWIARHLFPDMVTPLAEMLLHEKTHCAAFRDAMPERRARPCRLMSLWSAGGLVLGSLTALMGRQGVWTCTAAVEEAVHRHLDDQLLYLRRRDEALHALIASIQKEEIEHLRCAENRLPRQGPLQRLARRAIGVCTDILIWLSTSGDSRRMSAALRADT